jgi:hypothetical protein
MQDKPQKQQDLALAAAAAAVEQGVLEVLCSCQVLELPCLLVTR